MKEQDVASPLYLAEKTSPFIGKSLAGRVECDLPRVAAAAVAEFESYICSEPNPKSLCIVNKMNGAANRKAIYITLQQIGTPVEKPKKVFFD